MPMIDPAALKPLSAAILSDVMDSLVPMHQAMKPFVRPLDDSLVLVGRARAGLYMPAYEVKDREHPYEAEIALVDDLRPGDVVVLACNGSTDRIAPRGGTAVHRRHGARRGRLRHQRLGARRAPDPRATLSHVPWRHRPAGHQRPRPHDAARRAGGVRQRGRGQR